MVEIGNRVKLIDDIRQLHSQKRILLEVLQNE